MNRRVGARSPTAQPATPKRLKYETVRDHFLREAPQTDEEALDFFVHLGMYMWGRWQSISADTPNGQPIDEDGSTRWDDCTDREFDDIRVQAEDLIDREVARRRISAFIASLVRDPWGTILKGLSWAVWRMWEHFWGAIGILFFGLLLVWVFPHFVKEMRSAFDETLPQQTSPYNQGETVNAPATPVKSDKRKGRNS